MIVRMWRGRVHPGSGPAYLAHLESSVFPQIRALPGNHGARVLQGLSDDDEFLVLTEWTDLEAVSAFAGPSADVAVVPKEARALLASYDSHVQHLEVVLESS